MDREHSARAAVLEHLDRGEFGEACAAQKTYEAEFGRLELTLERERALLAGLIFNGDIDGALARFTIFEERGQFCPPGLVLSAADALVNHSMKPCAALRLLDTLDTGTLDDVDRKRLDDLTVTARRQIADGVLET